MDESTTVEWLSTAIRKATRSAKFCVAGCLPIVDPGIEVEGLGTIKLPLKPTPAKELIASCQTAPYGKGTRTLVNKKVRNTGVPIHWCSRRPAAHSNGPSSVLKPTGNS